MTMYTLTAADFADTGQWRLLIEIECTGLKAWLENTLHKDVPLQPLCTVKWDINKDLLRTNIEDAVYSNPRLLDDFAARIILFDPRTLFIPSEVAEEEYDESSIYRKVYTAEPSDVMTARDADITAAWSMAPGIKNFLMRTFPGSVITCNLLEKVRNARKKSEGLTLFVYGRHPEVDLILLDGRNLVSASTHEWRRPDDVAYLSLNLIDVYHHKLKDVKIISEGLETDTEAWRYISKHAVSFLDQEIFK